MPKLFSPVLETEIAEEKNLRDNRMSRVTLLMSSSREHIDLTWNVGGKFGRDTLQKLYRGKSATLPIGRAESYFGKFTIPHDLELLKDERERETLIALYYKERERALMTWGDYPRPRKIADGFAPIGTHRFPDVAVQVIEQDGTEWETIRLHQLYDIGEFDTLQFIQVESASDVRDEYAARNERLEMELAELKGQMKALLTLSKNDKVVASGGR